MKMELPTPPPDTELRNIIDKLAQFVARNGPEFEQMTKNKQKGNPKFSFLFGGDYYHYYQYKVTTEQALLKQKECERRDRDVSQTPATTLSSILMSAVQGIAAQQNNLQNLGVNTQAQVGTALQWLVQQQQVAAQQNAQALQQTPLTQIQPPGPTIESIVQQQQALHEQTAQSEQNLNAQHMVLLQQQEAQVDEAIRKSELESLVREADELGINLNDLDSILQPIIDSCTKDSISNGKAWILQRATSKSVNDLLARCLLYKVLEPDRKFTHKLHIIYLVNDILHHCVRKHTEEFKLAIEQVVVPMFSNASLGVTEDQQAKLNKLLTIWETKNHYFSDELVSQLKDPNTSWTRYKAQRVVDHSDIAEAISAGTKSALTTFQSQHLAFVSHAHRQIQSLEQQKQQLEAQQKHHQQHQQQQQQQAAAQVAAAAAAAAAAQVAVAQVAQVNAVHSDYTKHSLPQEHDSGSYGPPPAPPAPHIGSLEPPGTSERPPPPPPSQSQTVHMHHHHHPQQQPQEHSQTQQPPPPQLQPPQPQLPPTQQAAVEGSLAPQQLQPPNNQQPPPPTAQPPSQQPLASQAPTQPPAPPTGQPPFELPINVTQPPPGFFPPPPGGIELPDLTRPPPGFPPVQPEIQPEDLLPSLPYYDLPAGLMVPLIKLEDFSYKPLDPDSIRLPPPAPPSERLLAAVKAFYTPPGHDHPRDSDGWEKLGLYEYFRAKAAAKKKREQEIEEGIREQSRSPTPVRSFHDNKSPPPKRRYSSRSRSRSRDRERGDRDGSGKQNRKRRRSQKDRSPHVQQQMQQRANNSVGNNNETQHGRRTSVGSLPTQNSGSSSTPLTPGVGGSDSVGDSSDSARDNRSPTPPSFLGVGSYSNQISEDRLSEANKGHQMLRKMGWSGAGLGVKEQGIEQPISGGDVRDRIDQYKGVGINLNDPYENFRKSKGQAFITRMKARAEEKNGLYN
ncbi:SR-related CTD associated factor 6 [Rhodnius prolixus]|uniref:Calcium homeostasis endoplasmic reticulum protein n=1 Tax=Rhodnius prolixus TaxID=13249 RepID=A0ABL0DLX6_RHOPR